MLSMKLIGAIVCFCDNPKNTQRQPWAILRSSINRTELGDRHNFVMSSASASVHLSGIVPIASLRPSTSAEFVQCIVLEHSKHSRQNTALLRLKISPAGAEGALEVRGQLMTLLWVADDSGSVIAALWDIPADQVADGDILRLSHP
jgi:hypothetical protein